MQANLVTLAEIGCTVHVNKGQSARLSVSLRKNQPHISAKKFTPSKNNLFRKSNACANGLCHENGCIKTSSQLQGEHCKR